MTVVAGGHAPSAKQNPAYSSTYESRRSSTSRETPRVDSQQHMINFDPFADPTAVSKPWVNPYAGRMRQALTEGTLPIVYGPALRTIAGNWRSLLRPAKAGEECRDRKLYLEIGCHLGKVLTEMATEVPEADFVGLDITLKRVVSSAEKIRKHALRNAVCAHFNAKYLNLIFAPGELDGVIVFFPDPWSKPSQVKNRLVNSDFVHMVGSVLKPTGFIWIKTDQPGYFGECKELLTQAGFEPATTDQGDPVLSTNWQSSFEQLFKSRNVPTDGQIWVKQTTKN
jgi:tRNA (guanine-N7-)-methyltransferase